MATAKCSKCGGSAIADTFEQARKLINHAVGLSRGIKCGDNYNQVREIKTEQQKPEKVKPTVISENIEQTTETNSETIPESTFSTEPSKKPKKKKQYRKHGLGQKIPIFQKNQRNLMSELKGVLKSQ